MMYKLMIIEDEIIERKALRMSIEKNCIYIGMIIEAENGQEAVEKYTKYLPDIILVDINIPVLGGLEVIRTIINYKKQRCCKFIIVSANNTFEYAKKALQLGVEDFLVKPVPLKQISQILSQVIDKLEEEKKQSQTQKILNEKIHEVESWVIADCIYGILRGEDEGYLIKMLHFFGIKYEAGMCIAYKGSYNDCAIKRKIDNMLKLLGIDTVSQLINGVYIWFLISKREKLERHLEEVTTQVRYYLETYNYTTEVGFGQIEDSILELKMSYYQAIEQLECRVNRRIDMDTWVSKMSKYLLMQEMDGLTQCLKELFKLMEDESTHDLIKIKQCVYQLIILLRHNLLIETGDHFFSSQDKDEFIQVIAINDMRALYVFMEEKLVMIGKKIDENHIGNTTKMINSAMTYIHNHFKENISLESMASELNISACYLSKLFKKVTHKNFVDFVTEARLEQAKWMIIHTEQSIKAVSYEVGFNNPNYFTKVFKKHIGISPKEFKEKIK